VHTLGLTDHDTVAGVEEALSAGRATGVRVIPGIELSVRVERGTFHLLGHFAEALPPPLAARLDEIGAARDARNREMVARLAELDVPVAWEDVARRAAGRIGRPHIADALVAAGHAPDREEAFRRYLADDAPAYIPAGALEPEEAVTLVKAAGGTATVAHPRSLRLTETELDGFLQRLAPRASTRSSATAATSCRRSRRRWPPRPAGTPCSTRGARTSIGRPPGTWTAGSGRPGRRACASRWSRSCSPGAVRSAACELDPQATRPQELRDPFAVVALDLDDARTVRAARAAEPLQIARHGLAVRLGTRHARHDGHGPALPARCLPEDADDAVVGHARPDRHGGGRSPPLAAGAAPVTAVGRVDELALGHATQRIVARPFVLLAVPAFGPLPSAAVADDPPSPRARRRGDQRGRARRSCSTLRSPDRTWGLPAVGRRALPSRCRWAPRTAPEHPGERCDARGTIAAWDPARRRSNGDRPRIDGVITAARRGTARRLVLGAAGCWVIALLTVVTVVGSDAWPLALSWAAAGLVVAAGGRVLPPRPRALVASVLVPVCALFVFEGGLFFLPAAVVLTAAAVVALPRARGTVG
jgi:predicted metal-dependent phosphoesterase TrpH